MNVIKKLLIRKPTATLLLLLLLALSIGFSGIGCAAWFNANEQLQTIETFYTTLAVPTPEGPQAIGEKWREGGLQHENGDIHWRDGTITYSKDSIAAVAETAPQVAVVANSGFLSAALLNSQGLASGTLDRAQYQDAFDWFTYSFCVLAVKCTSIEDFSHLYPSEITSSEGTTIIQNAAYQAKFKILECLSLMDSYGTPIGESLGIGADFITRTQGMGFIVCNEDGTFPFEPGKTYIIRGFFRDIWNELQWDETGTNRIMAPTKSENACRVLNFTEAPISGSDRYVEQSDCGVSNFILEEHTVPTNSDDLSFWTASADSLPFYAEYSGDLDAFLQSPEGQVWTETIIPWTELNQNSAAVILTDNLFNTFNFNTGTASMVEGRVFSQEEYDSGADVCLVSAAFALHNSLTLGDRIQLDYYDTGIYRNETSIAAINAVNDYIFQRLPLTPGNRIGLQKEYEIVGIYTSPEFSLGQHNFPADTIFVPKASVPNAEAYEDPQVPYLNALVLENGTQEDFAQYMADHDMANTYTFVDMSYEDTRPALEAMAANAQRMMFIGLAVFLLVAGLYLFLLLRRMGPVSRSMRLLGVSRGQTWSQLLAAAVPMNLLAAALGLALGAVLFAWVTATILSATVAFSWKPMLLCAGAEAAALLAITLLATGLQARTGLMQRK